MDGKDVAEHSIITGVKPTGRELGQGAYGRVFVVDYNGVTCAAKEIYLTLKFEDESERSKFKRNFLRECLLHSKLHHPNIVKMLGVYYPNDQAVLPVLVMELMECNLTQLLNNYQNIPMYVKLLILKDVSRAICYLHTLNPPLIHRDLSPDNIFLTSTLLAKVSDFAIMKIVFSITRAPGTVHFMPPEEFEDDPHYGLPLDVFSFGCVVCHVITQRWPEPSSFIHFDPVTGKQVLLSKVERRQRYINQISEGLLKQLVITCLDNDQERRPPISVVSERITSIITS